jgi:hypothetical protein
VTVTVTVTWWFRHLGSVLAKQRFRHLGPALGLGGLLRPRRRNLTATLLPQKVVR